MKSAWTFGSTITSWLLPKCRAADAFVAFPLHTQRLVIANSSHLRNNQYSPTNISSNTFYIPTYLYIFVTFNIFRSFFVLPGIKCPVCNKFVLPDDIECHLVMCLTKPRLSYNGEWNNYKKQQKQWVKTRLSAIKMLLLKCVLTSRII